MADVRKNTIHILDISGYTAEGMGVARLEGRVAPITGGRSSLTCPTRSKASAMRWPLARSSSA